MSWFANTLGLWQWLLVLMIPPAIVLLYFLKLKRQPLEVPSTYLWHRTIEDLHVNSIWQKLRQNLLLLLQLLLLLLAILSLLRPYWEGSKLSGNRYIFLVDTSASMSSTDVKPTRLEAAKEMLINMIEQDLAPGAVAMVISYSDRAIVEQPFTDNRRQLVSKIRAIEQTQRPSMLEEALRVAAGRANPGRIGDPENEADVAAAEAIPATLMILSDGRYRSEPKFAMGNLYPEYVRIGDLEAKNVGITAFSTASSTESIDEVQAFVQVENYCSFDTEVTLQLFLGDTMIDAASFVLQAGTSRGTEFEFNSTEDGELRLEIEQNDDFMADNIAYAALRRPRKAHVLFVTPGNEAIDLVLNTDFVSKLADVNVATPDVLETEEYTNPADSGAFDLVIYDRCAPKQMPQASTLFIGSIPPEGGWEQEEVAALPQVIDADYAHPILQFVQFGTTAIIEGKPLKLPSGASMLVDSQFGPIMAIGAREGFEDLVQGFEIISTDDSGQNLVNTNWQTRHSFPVFIGNVITYLGGISNSQASPVIEPGQPISLRTASPKKEVRVESPTGQSLRIGRSPQGVFFYGNTEIKGIYDVREENDDEISQQFTVNLFDQYESNIVPAEVISTDYEKIEGVSAWVPARREGWKYLLLAALLILLIEWYIYNRRVYV